MKVLQVVGFKNSGKTTLISRWIRLLKKQGMTVAVLKHHGHQSPLERPADHTDGVQYIDSGANVSLVAGAGNAQILLNEEPSFSQLIEYVKVSQPDVLLIEGFKNENERKVVLLRDQEDWNHLKGLRNIELVIPHDGTKGFQYLTEVEVDKWFIQWVEEPNHETV